MTERDEQGRFVTSGQPDVVDLITRAYAERQEEAAAAPLTAEELALGDKAAEEVLAEDAKANAKQQHGEFLAGILFPEGKPDDGDS